MSKELYKVHRPKRLEDVVGQAAAVKTLRAMKEIPHALLFKGPSGTGKTTMARIVADELLGCKTDGNTGDYTEVNCALVESPIDAVRKIEQDMEYAPLGGNRARVWVLDEVQSLSRAGFAQQSMLKLLEDTPDHVYLILCTTDDKKLLPTIRTRCSEVVCKAIVDKDMMQLLRTVCGREKAKVSDDVLAKVVTAAGGSARSALVQLEKVVAFADGDDQMDAVSAVGVERSAFELVKVLMPFKGTPRWADVAAVLKEIEAEDPEGLRHMVMASARSTLLRPQANEAQRAMAYKVIDSLRDPLFDRNSGNALLAARCYEIIKGT